MHFHKTIPTDDNSSRVLYACFSVDVFKGVVCGDNQSIIDDHIQKNQPSSVKLCTYHIFEVHATQLCIVFVGKSKYILKGERY